MQVGDLFISLGIKPTGFADVNRQLGGLMRNVTRFAVGAAAVLGVRGLGRSMIGLNSSIADAKNQIGAVLALSRGTGMNEQLGDANKLYDGLRAKAAELPGTTKQYVDMLAMLAQPMAKANLSTEQMIDMTTGAMTSSRGLNENWQKTARDIREFLNFGKMNAVDTFARLMLPDFDSDAGKKQLKAMTVSQRAQLMAARVNQKAMKDLQAAQSASFSGRVDKLADTAQLFLARAGEKLFVKLGDSIRRATKWLDENKAAVNAAADAIGGALATAFDAVGSAIGFLLEHGDATKAVILGIAGAMTLLGIRSAIAWALALGPILPLVAIISGAVYLFTQLRGKIGDVGAAIVAAGAGVAALFAIGKLDGMIKGMRALVALVRNYGTATMTSSSLGAIQAANNQRAMMGMSGGFNAANMAAGAAAVPMGAGAGTAAGTAAKAGGGGVMAALGPVGWTILGAKLLSDATGGDFQDQARAKGLVGAEEDLPFWEVMQRIGGAQANVASSGNTTNTTTINVAPMGAGAIVMHVADGKEAGEKFAAAYDEKMAASLRAARHATGGNR